MRHFSIRENPHEVPFARIYYLGPKGKLPADAMAPQALASVLQSRRAAEVDGLELPGGPWPEATTQGVVLPLFSSTQDNIAGLIVLGVSPRRPLDAEYRTFFDLVAGHVATAIRNVLAYEQERKRAEALAEIDRAKTVFFSNVSHEFRTPLTLLSGPLEEALDDTNTALSYQERERLTLAHCNAYRLLRLVNTLLDFSRIEAGRAEAVYDPTDLSAYTAELASVFRSAIERAGMELVVVPLKIRAPASRKMNCQRYSSGFTGSARSAAERTRARVLVLPW